MSKEEIIESLKKGHKRLERVVGFLKDHDMMGKKLLGKWSIKEILSHLSAWNWKQVNAINEIIGGNKPEWWGLNDDEFNHKAIEERKDMNLEDVLAEWKESFKELIKKAEWLSEEDWFYEAPQERDDKLPVSVHSMLSYRYRGEDHEGGHAKQIEELLPLGEGAISK